MEYLTVRMYPTKKWCWYDEIQQEPHVGQFGFSTFDQSKWFRIFSTPFNYFVSDQISYLYYDKKLEECKILKYRRKIEMNYA